MADDNTKLTRQELENKEKLEDINERREKGLINEREHLREVLALGERQITQATERLKVEEKRASLLDSDIDKRTRKIALEERSAKLALEALEAAGASDDELRKQLQTLEQIRKEQDRINSAYSASVGLAESIATKLGLSANFQNSFLGSAMSTKS